jgi:prophage regulatory protein
MQPNPFESANSSAPMRIVRHRDVRAKLGLSAATLFDLIARGEFPRPFAIVPGGRAVGWLEAEVDAWIRARRVSREERAA